MAVNDFVAKVSGTVAYTDNSHGSFEATAKWRNSLGGLVAQHNSADSKYHFSQLYADESIGLNSMLGVFPGSISLSPAATTPNKKVKSFVMEVSGRVVYDKTKVGSFIAQWVDGVVDIFPSETDATWAALTSDGSAKAFLVQVFESLVGSNNATIS